MKFQLFIGIFFIQLTVSYTQLSCGVNAGYSFQLTGQKLEEGNHFKNFTSDIISISRSNFGTGQLTSFWIDYQISKLFLFKAQYSFLNNQVGLVDRKIFESIRKSEYEADVSLLSLSLGLKNTFKSFTYTFYLGGNFFFKSTMINNLHLEEPQFNFLVEEKTKYTDDFSFGISAENQFLYHFNFKKELFIGLLVGINYSMFSPDKSEVISYLENGIEKVNTLTTYERVTIYRQNYAKNIKEPIDPNVAKNTLKQYYNRSSLNISAVFGIKF